MTDELAPKRHEDACIIDHSYADEFLCEDDLSELDELEEYGTTIDLGDGNRRKSGPRYDE